MSLFLDESLQSSECQFRVVQRSDEFWSYGNKVNGSVALLELKLGSSIAVMFVQLIRFPGNAVDRLLICHGQIVKKPWRRFHEHDSVA